MSAFVRFVRSALLAIALALPSMAGLTAPAAAQPPMPSGMIFTSSLWIDGSPRPTDVHPGDHVRFAASAANFGDDAAYVFLALPIPQGTTYVPGSVRVVNATSGWWMASPSGSHGVNPNYSLTDDNMFDDGVLYTSDPPALNVALTDTYGGASRVQGPPASMTLPESLALAWPFPYYSTREVSYEVIVDPGMADGSVITVDSEVTGTGLLPGQSVGSDGVFFDPVRATRGYPVVRPADPPPPTTPPTDPPGTTPSTDPPPTTPPVIDPLADTTPVGAATPTSPGSPGAVPLGAGSGTGAAAAGPGPSSAGGPSVGTPAMSCTLVKFRHGAGRARCRASFEARPGTRVARFTLARDGRLIAKRAVTAPRASTTITLRPGTSLKAGLYRLRLTVLDAAGVATTTVRAVTLGG